MPKKTYLTSRDRLKSNTSNISCIIARNWLSKTRLIRASVGRKPDWLGSLIQKKVILKINFKIKLLTINLSKILPKIGKGEIDL